MTSFRSRTTRGSRRWSSIAGALLIACTAAPLLAQGDPPTQPTDKRSQPALTDPELRKKLHDALAKRLESRRRELEKLDQALKMFDEGKSLEDIRTLLPDMPHPGQRGEGWLRRWEEGAAGSPDAGPGQGGMNRGPAAEPPHPLTDEERQTVRDILKETAPKTLEKLRALESTKPAEADQQYSEALRRSRFLLEVRKRDPQMFELRLQEIRHGRQAGEAAQGIAALDAPPKPGETTRPADVIATERTQKVDQLRDALRQQYDVRTQIMQREGERMTADVTNRSSQAAASIEKSMAEMIDRAKRGKANKGPDGERRGGDHHPQAEDQRSSATQP